MLRLCGDRLATGSGAVTIPATPRIALATPALSTTTSAGASTAGSDSSDNEEDESTRSLSVCCSSAAALLYVSSHYFHHQTPAAVKRKATSDGNSNSKSAKVMRARNTTAGGLGLISNATNNLADRFGPPSASVTPTAATALPSSPICIAAAIAAVEASDADEHTKVAAIDLFSDNTRKADTYNAIKDLETRKRWLLRNMKKDDA